MGGYSGSYDYSISSSTTRRSASSYNDKYERNYEVKKALPPPKGKELKTNAKFPLVIAVDVTGSMRNLPGIIFEKLCMLYNETLYFLPKELKKSFEISFAAIGDAYCDEHPIQITDFAKESELDEHIKSLYPEGGGGGQTNETYELIAYYYYKHCKLSRKLERPKPMFIFIGDEGYYSKIHREHIEVYIGDVLQSEVIYSKEIFEGLKKNFDVYILRIEYQNSHHDELKINKKWCDILGKERVIKLKDPKRIVDIILGLIAANVDEFKSFSERIEIRQTPEQVKEVYSNLNDLRINEKIYNYNSNECPTCNSKIDNKTKDFCEYCGSKILKINNMRVFYK